MGPMAGPALMDALGLRGRTLRLNGRLLGGARAGVEEGGWPCLFAADAPLTGVEVMSNGALERYAAVMGLAPQNHEGRAILGISGSGPCNEPPWTDDSTRDALAAEIARQILEAPADAEAAQLASRLPMMGTWASSRLRAAAMPPSGGTVVARRGRDQVRVLEREQPFRGYFAVERQRLTHVLHQGGQSQPMIREGFLMGDAVVVLPWDPRRDRVLVIEQFRLAPALRGDPQPWLLEPIAGRVDPGETVEEAALREAREEADLTIRQLIPCFHAYPSPGAVCEFLYHYVGIADLPDDVAGIHGLDGEAEDIRGHLMPRDSLSAMVDARQITNAPLIALSLWLDARAGRLRGEPSRT